MTADHMRRSFSRSRAAEAKVARVEALADDPLPVIVETLCEVMHDAYEAAAQEAGWETQARSRVPWADVPEANKVTMRAAVRALLTHPLITADRAAMAEVEALHRRDEPRYGRWCRECGRAYPCPTVCALGSEDREVECQECGGTDGPFHQCPPEWTLS